MEGNKLRNKQKQASIKNKIDMIFWMERSKY